MFPTAYHKKPWLIKKRENYSNLQETYQLQLPYIQLPTLEITKGLLFSEPPFIENPQGLPPFKAISIRSRREAILQHEHELHKIINPANLLSVKIPKHLKQNESAINEFSLM